MKEGKIDGETQKSQILHQLKVASVTVILMEELMIL